MKNEMTNRSLVLAVFHRAIFLSLTISFAFCSNIRADDGARNDSSKLTEVEQIENAPKDKKLDVMLRLMRADMKPGTPEGDCIEGVGYYMRANAEHEPSLKKRYGSLALEYMKRAAEAGSAQCQANLGRSYLNGILLERDPVLARGWFERAIEKESCAAAFGLGEIYFYGLGVDKNTEKAVSYIRPSAERECPESAELMGVIEYEGALGQPDYESAVKHFAVAMNGGRAHATRNIGLMYLYGHGVNKNVVEAAALCKYALYLSLSENEDLRAAYEFVMKKIAATDLPKVEERYQYYRQRYSKKRTRFRFE